ncbi:MAG: hypothetical protein ACLUEK_03140 [Oscillospiraceae bacterium]
MKKLNKTALKWTILAIALLQMGGMGLSPSLAAISADMPEVPVSIVQTITSFPSFVMIFVCIAAIKLPRSSAKARAALRRGAILAAGILGYLLHSSIVELYIWAARCIGFGTILPTCSGILAENYDERSGGIMGIQSVFTNIGAMYLTYVGGALAVIKWNLNYLVYLIALLPSSWASSSFRPTAASPALSPPPARRKRSAWAISPRHLGLRCVHLPLHDLLRRTLRQHRLLCDREEPRHCRHVGTIMALYHRRHTAAPPSSTSTRSLTPTPSASPTSCSSWASC